MYILFPEELTEWAIFGAYDSVRINKLKDKIIEIIGIENKVEDSELKQKILEYCSKRESNFLNEKQVKMLDIIGINVDKKDDKQEFNTLLPAEYNKKTWLKKVMEKIKRIFSFIYSFE